MQDMMMAGEKNPRMSNTEQDVIVLMVNLSWLTSGIGAEMWSVSVVMFQ